MLRLVEAPRTYRWLDAAQLVKHAFGLSHTFLAPIPWLWSPSLSQRIANRRIPNPEALDREVSAWQTTRNSHNDKADWRFTTDKARIKLITLHPENWVIWVTKCPKNNRMLD